MQSRWVGNSVVETLASSTPSPPARYTSMSLCAVGTISHRHFDMQPHGNWCSALPHPFHDHAATFVLKGEGSQIISMTWPNVMDNLKRFTGDQQDNTLTAHGGIVFTHRLFRVSEIPRKPLTTNPYFLELTSGTPCSGLTPLPNA